MEYLLAIIVLGIAVFVIIQFTKHRSLYPFLPYMYNFRRRRNMFRKVMKLLDQTQAKMLVETGTSRTGLAGSRGDGAATIVFGKWAKMNAAFLHSVDINEQAIAGSRQEVMAQNLGDCVQLHLSDSVAFLKNFEQKVDFLYLDSYDYSKDDLEVQRKSQEHHLKEFKAIENKLHDKSIVLIDDCGLPNGGKGKTVIAYMKQHGWKVLREEYQVLLVREGFE